MTLRHLEIFLSVCDHKNMTHAARDLYLSQPSVSQAIFDLEAEYGVRLFERLNHRLYLTASGERLQSYARHISQSYRTGQKGTLRAAGRQPPDWGQSHYRDVPAAGIGICIL